MHNVFIHINVKPDQIDAFIEATKDNALNSLKERGVLRFDFFQMDDDPCRFVLLEIYRTSQDALRHKETPHYQKWRDGVANMMAEPRQGVRYKNILPRDEEWK